MTTTELILMIMNAGVLPLIAGLIGWMLSKINTIARETKDLWEWHRPDQDGRQSWKNADLQKAIQDMVEEMRGLREDLRDQQRQRDS